MFVLLGLSREPGKGVSSDTLSECDRIPGGQSVERFARGGAVS